MSLGPGGFVILFLSTLLPFSGTFNLSVNQGLYTTLGMVSVFDLVCSWVNEFVHVVHGTLLFLHVGNLRYPEKTGYCFYPPLLNLSYDTSLSVKCQVSNSVFVSTSGRFMVSINFVMSRIGCL